MYHTFVKVVLNLFLKGCLAWEWKISWKWWWKSL